MIMRKKTRNEINLSRLLSRCTEMANQSSNLEQEWRLPKFISAAEEMFANLPALPHPSAPSSDERNEYQNQLQFLNSIAQGIFKDTFSETEPERPESDMKSHMLLPQGPAFTKNTISKQIAQKTAERAHQSKREELFGKKSVDGSGGGPDLQQQDFDKLIALHRDQQEKVAEEMLNMTKRLKEQTLAAKSIVQEDVTRADKISKRTDENISKLQTEGGRISKLASRWNCRCWIWLAMFIVILTFVGMVLLMKLFKKKMPVLPPVHTEL